VKSPTRKKVQSRRRRLKFKELSKSPSVLCGGVIFDWVQSGIIEIKNGSDDPDIRLKGKTIGEIFIRADTPKGKVGSVFSFILPENPAPHNSLLMDATKLISTLLRKLTELTMREKIPKNKGDIFMH